MVDRPSQAIQAALYQDGGQGGAGEDVDVVVAAAAGAGLAWRSQVSQQTGRHNDHSHHSR